MISDVAESSEASIDEIKFHNTFFNVTKFSKEWIVWPKTHFLVFALFVGNFSNKHHYNLLKILRIFCYWYFCPKSLFPKLFVFKVDVLLTSSRITLNHYCIRHINHPRVNPSSFSSYLYAQQFYYICWGKHNQSKMHKI